MNQALANAIDPRISSAPDEAGLLRILYDIENTAASSYVSVLGQVEGTNGAALVSGIQPIESRHATFWGGELGLPLDQVIPSFENLSLAADPNKYPIEG